jgi:hypothetical protein
MKLSPMLNDRDLESLGACVRFVSFGGECREALVFAGSDAPTGWEAVHLESGEMLTKPARETAVQMAEEPGEFLYEVDPAAIRAGLIGEVCAPIKAEPLADSNGYATSNQTCQSVWLTGYRVLGSCSSDAKQLKASLSKLGAGKLVLKQRHAGLDLEKMRRQFERGTGRPVTLAFYKNRKSIRCALLEAL